MQCFCPEDALAAFYRKEVTFMTFIELYNTIKIVFVPICDKNVTNLLFLEFMFMLVEFDVCITQCSRSQETGVRNQN